MNVSQMRPPPGRFEDRLEAELVKVVTARAAPRQPAVRAGARAGSRAGGRAGSLARGRAGSLARGRAGSLARGRAGVLVAGTAAAVAAGFALGVPVLTHRPAEPPRGKASEVHIRTAAFTVDSRTDGTVRVTWDKSQYFNDAAGLQQALRGAGFPVLIRQGVFCEGPQDDASLGPGGVGPGVARVMRGEQQHDGTVVFIFTPSAMPAGKELFIGYLSASQLAVTRGQPGSVERLVPTGVPLTCSTQLPLVRDGQQSPGHE